VLTMPPQKILIYLKNCQYSNFRHGFLAHQYHQCGVSQTTMVVILSRWARGPSHPTPKILNFKLLSCPKCLIPANFQALLAPASPLSIFRPCSHTILIPAKFKALLAPASPLSNFQALQSHYFNSQPLLKHQSASTSWPISDTMDSPLLFNYERSMMTMRF
jgi:hypothetical protein